MQTRSLHLRLWPASAVLAIIAILASLDVPAAESNLHAAQWESEIRAFEAADETNPPPHDAVLFIGSSSIRKWQTLAEDFPGHKVLNRGFGGSHLADSVAFAERIVIPYKPRLVLLYAGDNDIAAGRSPEEVLVDFRAFVRKIRAALPQTQIAYISIKPCPAREKYLDLIKTTNRLVKKYVEAEDKLRFIDVFTPMLTQEGRPRPDLFLPDGLHPNARGYAVWTAIIRPILEQYQHDRAPAEPTVKKKPQAPNSKPQ